MCATYRDKERRSNFESFANKIYTGIRELKPEYAEKRAIWELFQNALDTVEENGIIEIAKTDKGLLFKHNGRPFKDDEFGGLIKQFSVGKTYGNNSEKLGQYGTGFISTHVYGKKIFISGSILTDDNSYRTLEDFELDRDVVSLEELTDKILIQDNYIAELCDNNQASEKNYLPYTSFEYKTAENQHKYVDAMLEYIKTILPYIFCFNEKLQSVNLSYDSTNLKYIRTSISNNEINISLNNEPIIIPFIKNSDNNIKVILPSKDRILKYIPKQFLFYPLMETAEVGYNFIIHANDFKPNRERDYLHKDNANAELKVDVEINEKLLECAFDLVLQKVEKDESTSFIDLVKIEFTGLESDFEKEIKVKYINRIKGIKRIEIDEKKEALDQIFYFDNSILSLDEESKSSVYSLLSQFKNLPLYDSYCNLSSYANNWNENMDNIFSTLTLTDIGKIIIDNCRGNYYFILDKLAYKKFVSEIATDITLLNTLELIPNIHGDLKHFDKLVKWEIKEELLIDVVDTINSSVSEKYIHSDFEFLENINPYNREKFKEDFSKFCNDLLDNLSKDKVSISSTAIRFQSLIESLNIFIGLNKNTRLNTDTNAFYNKVFELTPISDELSTPTVDVNYQPAIKLLAHLYIRNFIKKDIKSNIDNLKEIITIMYGNTNLKEELLHKLECIPNQNFCLKSQSDLKKDNVKDEEFKDEWNTIVGGNIREELVQEGFEVFLQHSSFVSGPELGSQIEQKLNPERKFIPVDKIINKTVLRLIEQISFKQSTWGQWLREINLVKEEILMDKFQEEETRQSLFSILSVNDDKINLLGQLAKIDNLNDLIRAGKEKQKEEGRKSNHLIYIKEIGLKIQTIIENELNLSLKEIIEIIESSTDKKLSTIEEQNGQDFIIYKSEKPIYYIEVKSRWDSEGIVALSKRQVECCAKNKSNYAVITVNVANYKAKNKIDMENISFEDLKDDVKVNLDLSDDFEILIKENNAFEKTIDNTKLIEFRGHIPQKRIENKGIIFDDFISELKKHLIDA